MQRAQVLFLVGMIFSCSVPICADDCLRYDFKLPSDVALSLASNLELAVEIVGWGGGTSEECEQLRRKTEAALRQKDKDAAAAEEGALKEWHEANRAVGIKDYPKKVAAAQQRWKEALDHGFAARRAVSDFPRSCQCVEERRTDRSGQRSGESRDTRGRSGTRSTSAPKGTSSGGVNSRRPADRQPTSTGVRFTAEEVALLRTLRQKEEAAGLVSSVLKYSPFVELLNSRTPEDLVTTIATNSWDLMADALRGLARVRACTLTREIDQYLLDHNGTWPDTEGSEFLRQLRQTYDARCS